VVRRRTVRRPFDAILFDLDGTLADSADDIADALHQAFRAIDLTPRHPIAALVDGSPLEELFAVAAPEADAQQFERFVSAYRGAYLRGGYRRTRLYPGVAETLDALSSLRPPVRLAVATSRRADAAVGVTEALGIAHRFEHIEGSGGTQLRTKPAPDLLLLVARRMALDPTRVLMVGDTPRDIAAGRAAGMSTAAVLYGLGRRDQLQAERPDHLLEDLEDILGLMVRDAPV
jgi:HAD superfamily hydrolase (TIGR01509 family)